ncbi:(2Fe-2S)-binding protein [Streptomyces durbertensis]|uniref:Bacterioferritin-associated ferredoxin n=1 Tax=Streptomyces durbertensis TaxID=2448886 RepID=A0ABR6EBH0_9ACTN|nr:(2Fe-2S)-binding protein [Streptomyces durbertensis]MBB1242671.1 (2Fe-2S)-binding protein [Streptomyces durbertensis]
MYICSCFGVTEQQVREHAAAGACTPRQIASASKAGTDCGSCVRRIQGLLGRGCAKREQSAPDTAAALVQDAAEPPARTGGLVPAVTVPTMGGSVARGEAAPVSAAAAA